MLPFIYLLAATGATVDKPAAPAPLPMPAIQTYSLPSPPPVPPAPPLLGKSRLAIPANSPGSWVNSDDYPSIALRNRQSGTTRFSLEIDADGRVSSCTVTSSSGSPVLDLTTCTKIKQRAVFEPALDKKGRKTVGEYSNSVRWVLPTGPDPIPEAGVDVGSFIIDAEGNVSNCRYRDMRKNARNRNPCLNVPATFEPYLNAEGEPVAVRVTISTSVRVTEIEADPDADKGADEE